MLYIFHRQSWKIHLGRSSLRRLHQRRRDTANLQEESDKEALEERVPVVEPVALTAIDQLSWFWSQTASEERNIESCG